MQDVLGEAANHAKEAKNPHVKMGCCSRGTSHEHDEGFWCFIVQLLDILEDVFVVEMKDLHFIFFKH